MKAVNPVLVVVDVQNGFITDESKHVVPVIEQLVHDWLDKGRDVVFTRYLNYHDSPFEKIMGWSKLKESPEIDIVDELLPLTKQALTIVDKTIYTMYNAEGTRLTQNRGWTDVFVCGIDTEVCVLKTAVDAFERGIRAWILKDACASHSGSTPHEAGLIVGAKMIGRKAIIETYEISHALSSRYE
ncbi:isochorismatase family cysteine hydrolase [Pseudonocardia sp. N23]|uniref:isochorismatase family cysteine hydrolase n=1 Tax=Pseudonocardia sp. N23 TaxID=1987376 RepID=UPI000BFC992A|nr:isochorismatase family cysteine hydrolase [Pseudonocardia sp. N23]